MSNLSTLQRNILQAIDCEVAGRTFLRACDKVATLEAERFAFEHRDLFRFLAPALAEASRVHGLEQVPDGLTEYILDRHWNMRMS